jgi:hypothetical protein
MATYHCAIKKGTSKTKSAKRHENYICREKSYKNKEKDLEYKEHGNMPSWAEKDPELFWKAADKYERSNGRTYVEMELALPNELNREQRLELVKGFIQQTIGTEHPYSMAIHCPKATLNPKIDQPHAHVMFSERTLDGIERDPELFFKRANGKTSELGGAKKDLQWHHKGKPKEIRVLWAKCQNEALERYGFDVRVDHRSLKEQKKEAVLKGDYVRAQKLDRNPEIHMGPKVARRLSKSLKLFTAQTSITGGTYRNKEDEYFKIIEKSELAKKAYFSRKYRRTVDNIESCYHRFRFYNDAVKELKDKIQRIDQELIQQYKERKDILKKIITPEQAMRIAESNYCKNHCKGVTYRILEEENQNYNIEKEKLLKAYGNYEQNPNRTAEDYDKIKIWQTALLKKINENQIQKNELVQKLSTPEAQKKINDTAKAILSRNEIYKKQLNAITQKIGELDSQRTKCLDERKKMMQNNNTLYLGYCGQRGKDENKLIHEMQKAAIKLNQQSNPGKGFHVKLHLEENEKKYGLDRDF